MAKNYRLIELRGDRTQEQVAKDLEIDRSTYAHIENGTGKPSLGLAFRIAQYYGVPIDAIFFTPNVSIHHERVAKMNMNRIEAAESTLPHASRNAM